MLLDVTILLILLKYISCLENTAKKILVLVTTNATHMVSAVNQTGFAHIPFWAHNLQLSIFHGIIAAVAEKLSVKCPKIIGHLRNKRRLQPDGCKLSV